MLSQGSQAWNFQKREHEHESKRLDFAFNLLNKKIYFAFEEKKQREAMVMKEVEGEEWREEERRR